MTLGIMYCYDLTHGLILHVVSEPLHSLHPTSLSLMKEFISNNRVDNLLIHHHSRVAK